MQFSEVLVWPVYFTAVCTGLKSEAGKSRSTTHTGPTVFSLFQKTQSYTSQ